MADIKWIKVSTDIWNNKKIKQIESLKNGDAYIVIWMKLLTLAGTINDNGYIYVTPDIPFTDKGLSVELNKPVKIVNEAIELFEDYGMIEIEDGYIVLTGWEKYQNVEGLDKIREQTKERVKRYRQRKSNAECNVTSNADVTHGNATDIDIDKELDIKRESIERENGSLSDIEPFQVPQSVDDLYDFLPKIQLYVDEPFKFPIEDLEVYYRVRRRDKWKNITDEDSLAQDMYLWCVRGDDYKARKEYGA